MGTRGITLFRFITVEVARYLRWTERRGAKANEGDTAGRGRNYHRLQIHLPTKAAWLGERKIQCNANCRECGYGARCFRTTRLEMIRSTKGRQYLPLAVLTYMYAERTRGIRPAI